eukprot:TRINITY_DN16492_c0_g1_i1.p1 TRINITY_DN16492_c0_g1~~TRINITY_DN16492_c0_g1_i1.p1  ORF type:complete len:104 (-),score=10.67 TRINITY_DN16492_c0_g1_i1:16-327(-)
MLKRVVSSGPRNISDFCRRVNIRTEFPQPPPPLPPTTSAATSTTTTTQTRKNFEKWTTCHVICLSINQEAMTRQTNRKNRTKLNEEKYEQDGTRKNTGNKTTN